VDIKPNSIKSLFDLPASTMGLIDKFKVPIILKYGTWNTQFKVMRSTTGLFFYNHHSYDCQIELCARQIEELSAEYGMNAINAIFLHEVGHWFDCKTRPEYFIRAVLGSYKYDNKIRHDLEKQANIYACKLAVKYGIELDDSFMNLLRHGLISHRMSDIETDTFLIHATKNATMQEAA